MEHKIETLLQSLTLDEKIKLLAGADTWQTHRIERLGIPTLKVTDGPNGVRDTQKDVRSQTSASFPVGTAMGATWNPDMVREIGEALAEEVKTKGAHVLLGPTVNMHRHLLAGRNFECFSEDPFLMARMAVAYIQGVQSQRVGACIKHYVCNDQEFERFSISAEVDERTLRELYLPPFKVAVQEAGVWTLMTAYNRVNGVYASENSHLFDILKDEWGFDGLVLSDWYGTYSDRVPLERLDLEMPGPARWMAPEKVKAALKRGDITEADIDDKVRRLLRTLERVGAFDNSPPNEERSIDNPRHHDIIRRAGREAIVLLKNDDNVLPLNPTRFPRLAVIGRPASDVAFQGGGSSEVNPHYVVQPLDAMCERYGKVFDITYAPGPALHRSFPLLDPAGLRAEDGTPGKVTVRQYANTERAGEPSKVFLAGGTQLAWFGERISEFDLHSFSLTMSGTWTPPVSGTYVFSMATVGRGHFEFDGKTLLDWWEYTPEVQPQNFDGTVSVPWRQEEVAVDLEAGRAYPFRVDFAVVPGGRWRTIRLGVLPPQPADPIGEAVALAREADAALVFVGLTPEWESEGHDRESMDLPCNQNELVERVADANPNTIVVVNTGSPVHMPWLDKVKAVLQVWYLGQEMGNAITDVLFGEADPGGRLPTTFPKRLHDAPAYINYPGENGRVYYGERFYVGYRYYDAKEVEPLFPFGHGLSYTTFSYDAMKLAANQIAVGEGVDVDVTITNTGPRPGQEVVQVYVRDVEASLARPPKELKGFAKVALEAGETRTVTIHLRSDAFAFYDDKKEAWVVEPGTFEILVGRSAGDIRLRASLDVLDNATEMVKAGTVSEG